MTKVNLRFRIKKYMESDPGGEFWPEDALESVNTVLAWKPDFNLLEYADVIYERILTQTGVMYLTGRRVYNCTITPHVTTKTGSGDYLTFERRIPLPAGMNSIRASGRENMLAVNQLNDDVSREMINGMYSPDRLPAGKVTVDHALFLFEPLIEIASGCRTTIPITSACIRSRASIGIRPAGWPRNSVRTPGRMP
jgi:hypothetical protein